MNKGTPEKGQSPGNGKPNPVFIAAPVSVPVQGVFPSSYYLNPYIDQTAGFIQPTSFVPVYPAYIPSYPPQVAYCYPAPQQPAQLPPVSRKRSSSSGSVEESKREHSASDTTCSLRVYMSYLRQQYAFYPRWWYLFRLLVSVIQSNSQENRSLYIYVLQILLAGRKKERKLLASYLNVEFDKSKQTAFDRCFDKAKLSSTLPYLIHYCEEALLVKPTIDASLYPMEPESAERNRPYLSNRKAIAADDPWSAKEEALRTSVQSFQKRCDDLLTEFMEILYKKNASKAQVIVDILQDFSSQFACYGYFDPNRLLESVYSAIFSIPEAVQVFKQIIDV
ncbi:hypothetical protein AV274_4822 [Blastocystis sp. ATCC 50177/Nand II]|uniref:Uncharacterized protein n=1 Tax=Blastocystis sp. subtype 1 (strain ATCC 50177 / NandII) TaxID=478820 RepID=A0A196S8Y0_BLAHN|nr:hypothetical protein AV274_4822 [Blastocystis sp. ATCC 50177/Nand II]